MKRSGIVFTLAVVSILLISFSFVSAGLFDDIWDKITGGTVEENVSIESTDISEVEEPVEPEPEICGDGICQSGEVCDRDCCEAFCTLECPDGAVQGSCGCECISKIEPPIEPPIEDFSEPLSDNRECEEGEMRYYRCPDGTKVPNCGCENGMWVCKIFKDENCPDVGPGPETCAAKIQITFNKDVYKIGDDVKIIIETFDSQGNHVPNYAFYGQMYDNMWHSPDLQKTDNKGYLINTGIAEKPAGGVTEVKFKVYTKEIGSCGSVEDTMAVKFEQEECGIGECAPKPGCKDKVRNCGGTCTPCPEDDGDGEIFYPCSGCELEDKCYPYGYRKDGSFCSDENDLFVAQSGDDGKCENNFECKTNLCIDSNCVSSNVWNKFLGWFKKMFGGGDDEEPGPKECSKVLIEEDVGDYEYIESAYGPDKDTQAPLFSNDCEQIGTIKCCVAQYSENEDSSIGGIICPYNNRVDVENLVKCSLGNAGDFLGEYKDEKVMKMNKERVILWTHKNYALGIGKNPLELGIPEDIVDAYLNKYTSDLEEIDITNIPVIVDGKPFVFCTEEDERLIKECQISGGMFQSNPSSLDGTEEGKKSCINSKGFGEGCCEVFAGCANNCGEITHIPNRNSCYIDLAIKNKDVEVCGKIDDSNRRNKCYINVAEHTGNANICDKVSDSDLQEKCYFWVAGETGEEDSCAGIADAGLQAMCYVDVAIKTGDASFCDKITDSHIGDKCYRNVGIQTNNKVLCNKIIEEQAKQKCLDNTS